MQYHTNLTTTKKQNRKTNKQKKHFHPQELLDPLVALLAHLVLELLVLLVLPEKGADGDQRWLKAEGSSGFFTQNHSGTNKKTDLQLVLGVLVAPVVQYYLADPA